MKELLYKLQKLESGKRVIKESVSPDDVAELSSRFAQGEIDYDQFKSELEKLEYTDHSMRQGEMGHPDMRDDMAWDREKDEWDQLDRLERDDEDEEDLYDEEVVKEWEDDSWSGPSDPSEEEPSKYKRTVSKSERDAFNKAAAASRDKFLFNDPEDDARWNDMAQHLHNISKDALSGMSSRMMQQRDLEQKQKMAPRKFSTQMDNSELGVPDDYFRNMTYSGGPSEMELKQLYVNKLNKQADQHRMEYESITRNAGLTECGGEGEITTIPITQPSKQQDNVNMNINMSGSGAGGIRDLLKVLRDLDGKDSNGGSSVEVPFSMKTGSDGDMHGELQSGFKDKHQHDESYGNTPNEKYRTVSDVTSSGNDLHKSKGNYGDYPGGDNRMAVKERLESLYNYVKSK